MIQLFVPGGGSGSGGAVTEALPANTLGQTFADLSEGSITVPAGAYEVTVWNTGTTNITVAGATVAPGEQWKIASRENRSTTRTDFCPSVAIVVPAGGAAQYQVITPSA